MDGAAGQVSPVRLPLLWVSVPPSIKVTDVKLPVITLSFTPGVGIFQCVSTGMTITGKR